MYAVYYKPIIVKRTISLSSASRNHLKHGEARRRNEKAVITGTWSRYPCTAWPPFNLYPASSAQSIGEHSSNPHVRFHELLLKGQWAGPFVSISARKEDYHGERGGIRDLKRRRASGFPLSGPGLVWGETIERGAYLTFWLYKLMDLEKTGINKA